VLLSLLFLSIVVVVAVLLLFVLLLFVILLFVPLVFVLLLLLLGSCVVVVVVVGSVDDTGGRVEGATASSSVNATALKYGGGHAASTRESSSLTVSMPLLAIVPVEEGVAVVVPFAEAAVVAFDAHSTPHVSSATAALTAARTSVDPVSATSYTFEAVSGVVTRL
jgi:hypothetical protein